MDGAGAVGQLAQPGRIGGEGNHLHEDGQPFLGDGRGRRALGQEGADRLVQPVERGADMHQAFVHCQSADVALVEQGIGADLDVVGARRRIGEDAVGLEHPHHRLVAEHAVELALQHGHRIAGIDGLGFVLEVAAVGDVVQVGGEHHAQIGQGRVAGMEGIGRRAIQLLGDQPEIGGAARLEHADHHAVFLAHAPHDLPDRAELAELAGDVALDLLELLLLVVGIEGQRAALVVGPIHCRQLVPASLEEALADAVIPLDRIQHADRRLSLDQAVGQRTDGLVVFGICLAAAHRPVLVTR
ncbi:hypothetical protein D3C85_739410 [compost metagenome]